VRPQGVGRGDDLQIWRVAANIGRLKKQWRVADRGRSSILGVGKHKVRLIEKVTAVLLVRGSERLLSKVLTLSQSDLSSEADM
jgi:hypothetical protein